MSNKEPANSDAVEWFYYRPGRGGQKDSGSETVTYLTRPSRSSIYVEECLDLHRIYLASLRLVESLGDGVKFADPGSVARWLGGRVVGWPGGPVVGWPVGGRVVRWSGTCPGLPTAGIISSRQSLYMFANLEKH